MMYTHLTRKQTPPTEPTEITFPMLECWNPMTKVATIAAQVDKRRVLCRISIELLREKFQATDEEPMRAVAENRSELQATARKIIENESFEEDGSIVIRSRDF
jgi:hypothetical protein